MSEIGVELAHDLRMPLQLIYSSAQMLRLAMEDPSLDGRAYADMLMASVEQVKRLLNGALDGATPRRQDGPRWARGDLAACARELCLRCRPYADEKGVALRFSGNVASLPMFLDEDMLSRVLLNLISNALRFTPRGGSIRVELTARGDFAEIAVIDDGAGIAPERLPWIFLRGETDGGHGYGLPIARELARGMGGDLTARSTPGQGSAFTLRLPVRAVKAG